MGFFTYFLVIETKGLPIECIEDKFRTHWLWGRVMAKHDAAEAAKEDAERDDVAAARDTTCKVALKGVPAAK